MHSQMWLRSSCAPHSDAVQRCLEEAYACRITSRPTAQARCEGLTGSITVFPVSSPPTATCCHDL